ncbi:L,D-transpeptidase [Rhodobium gokarnense]|uniref:Lipoprotein-anchoring transpeptidase ErfK/SrfK n=1 Tax=Rhodobium gokarnense TaxID=364296 RepID=A0ABT3HCK7_9HYPH|nr:L,D-transpeptidase [Rhodobium gokarnense]MCW2308130.1 lipoprotein-anchoring transpeptidase ErfK/SrfK [Rhodobium gokarnense]
MKRLFAPMALMVFGMVATSGAFQAAAEGRYTQRPPVVLSPDLSEPWLLQLQPRRRAYREAPTYRRAPRTYGREEYRDHRRAPRLFGRRDDPTYRRAPAPARTDRYGMRWQDAPSRVRPASVVQPRPHVAKRSRREMDPKFLPQTVSYDGGQKPGTIIIDTNERFLYLVQSGGTAKRYGVGVGRPGFEWAGTHKITRKAEWPDWHPPAEMRQRQPGLPKMMAGGPKNPLGARAMYLGSTLYRIHGSNQPWTIGHAVSSGCIRMRNEDVVDLYGRVGVGTKVVVM